MHSVILLSMKTEGKFGWGNLKHLAHFLDPDIEYNTQYTIHKMGPVNEMACMNLCKASPKGF